MPIHKFQDLQQCGGWCTSDLEGGAIGPQGAAPGDLEECRMDIEGQHHRTSRGTATPTSREAPWDNGSILTSSDGWRTSSLESRCSTCTLRGGAIGPPSHCPVHGWDAIVQKFKSGLLTFLFLAKPSDRSSSKIFLWPFRTMICSSSVIILLCQKIP